MMLLRQSASIHRVPLFPRFLCRGWHSAFESPLLPLFQPFQRRCVEVQTQLPAGFRLQSFRMFQKPLLSNRFFCPFLFISNFFLDDIHFPIGIIFGFDLFFFLYPWFLLFRNLFQASLSSSFPSLDPSGRQPVSFNWFSISSCSTSEESLS